MSESLKTYVETNLSHLVEIYKENKHIEGEKYLEKITDEEIDNLLNEYECEIFELVGYFQEDCNLEGLGSLKSFKRWIVENSIISIVYDMFCPIE